MGRSVAVNEGQFNTAEIGAALVLAIDGGQTASAVRLAEQLAKSAWKDGYRAGRADQAEAASIPRR